MRKTILVTTFNFGYSFLVNLGDKCLFLISRDGVILATYGVDAGTIALITDLNQQLKDFPTDEELLGDVSIATETRDATRDEVKVFIRDIAVRARKIFGENSAKYRKFAFKGLDLMNDSELHRTACRVVRIAQNFLTVLAPAGLTQLMIDDLKDLAIRYDLEIDIKDDAVINRDESTENRIELGNQLYKMIVEVFDFGKTYWANKSEAKYNDYVIYNTPTGEPVPDDQLGAVHGNAINSVTLAPAGAGFIYVNGFEEPLEIDIDSAFGADGLAPGKYTGTAVITGYNDKPFSITIPPGEDIDYDILMDPTETPPVPPPMP